MIVIEVQKGESIEKALKRYKYKVIKTKQIDMLRERQEFVKKSVTKRMKKKTAKSKHYLQHIDTK